MISNQIYEISILNVFFKTTIGKRQVKTPLEKWGKNLKRYYIKENVQMKIGFATSVFTQRMQNKTPSYHNEEDC